MNKPLSCPYCGATESILCKQFQGSAGVFRAERILATHPQILYHDICQACGSVVRSFVTNPKNL